MAKSETQNNRSIGFPAIAVAVWAAVLIIAFLANRGSDIGQIGRLFENLGGGPLGGSAVADSFIGTIVAVLIAASWFGVGNFVLGFIKTAKNQDHSHVLELALKTAAGAAIWSLIWFFLGVADV